MLSMLGLRIDKYLDGDVVRPPEVFAKIYSINQVGKRKPTGGTRRELIPISHLSQHTKLIELEPGRYIVEAVLPSGELLADTVSLGTNEKKELVFRPEYSPHEWLSWQHLMGNVSAPPATKPSSKRRIARKASGGQTSKRRIARKALGGQKGTMKDSPPYLGAGPSHARTNAPRTTQIREVNVERPLQLLNTPHHCLLAKETPDQIWIELAELESSNPSRLIRQLNKGNNTVSIDPYAFDSRHGVFRLSWSQTSNQVHAVAKYINEQRCFLSVQRRTSVELLSLPMPWGNSEVPVEIAIQQPIEPTDFCSSISVMDPDFGMLLGYLSSGSIPTAREMAETAEGMLFEKLSNPYAAAAGAYALVGTALTASDREWHRWVQNLMNWFKHIPDGAIQWGQLKLRMRRSSDDIEEAKKAFKLAYRRGLPFYSMGIRWLVDGLEAISHNDDEAAQMLTHVRPVAWLTNFQQPFTILKL